ncbi:hypothetical protein [Yersinia bercovieri]|uniref:hypothetical protein n=2 Tax=Yersinia bercovieri TaxID=634 RepID=UPI001CFE17DC|nr:hypothetical protein [Yersinia bercovieri]MCB5302968.1 hypothetical protein [Yersinia bercovieri]
MIKRCLVLSMVVLLCACKEEPPAVKIEAFDTVNQFLNIPYVKVKVTAMVDEVEVKVISANRGNCKIENDRVTGIKNGQTRIPKTLKFGQSVTVSFSGPCSATQVDVDTDQGSWTQRYN